MSHKGKETQSTQDSGFYSGEVKSEILSEDAPCPVEDFTPMFLQPKTNKIQIVNSEHYFEQDEDGFTRLHIAVLHSDQRSIDSLLAICPDKLYLNLRNLFGMTPLHIAIMLRNYECVRKLIDHGCDVNMRCAGKNALHLAVENRDFQSAAIILSARTSTDKLIVDLETWNMEGETCFFVASKHSDLQLMRLLEDKGSDMNAREGRSGYTALHHAVERRSFDVIDFLLAEERVDVNVENYGGWTAYQLCLLNDCEQLATKLMRCGAIPYYTEESEEGSCDEMENSELISKIAEIAVN